MAAFAPSSSLPSLPPEEEAEEREREARRQAKKAAEEQAQVEKNDGLAAAILEEAKMYREAAKTSPSSGN